LIEYGWKDLGIFANNIYKSWKYQRQFFIQAMMASNFNRQTIEWITELWEEMEIYWNNLGEKSDLTQWINRFANDILFRIATGIKNDSIASYYNTLISNSLNAKDEEKFDESERFIQLIEIVMDGAFYFTAFNKYVRHYVPFIRGKAKRLLKNRDYLFDKIYNIIKERRIEIENSSLDQPLRYDMLTSYLTANTPHDINVEKHADIDLLRPMADGEVFDNIFDALLGGGTVSKSYFKEKRIHFRKFKFISF
jgi:hypothetical protein